MKYMPSPQETQLFQSEADYLRFHGIEDVIKVKDDYRDKIINWPPPPHTHTHKEISSFLGFTGYCTNNLYLKTPTSPVTWIARNI